MPLAFCPNSSLRSDFRYAQPLGEIAHLTSSEMVLVETQRLKTYFPILGGVLRRKVGEVKACDGISLKIERGEWFGLVGESGCGKTTLGKTILGLLPATSGHIFFDTPFGVKDEIAQLEEKDKDSPRLRALLKGYDLASFSGERLKKMRRRMQLVQQDPSTSLNPRMLIKDVVGEPLVVHRLAKGKEVKKRVVDLLHRVGMSEEHLYRYPHQFSGGQRQRIAIARALATQPDFIVLDEPTSALDVSVQAQLLDLLKELKDEMGLTYLYITHDLSVAECVCDRIAVMYLGKIVEIAPTLSLFQNPSHPYSRVLISSVPIPDPDRKREPFLLSGEVPSPAHPPSGCRFHPRCKLATEECFELEPPLKLVDRDHLVACWHPL